MITKEAADQDQIAHLTKWALWAFDDLQEIESRYGRHNQKYWQASYNYRKELERLGRALNAVVGPPRAIYRGK